MLLIQWVRLLPMEDYQRRELANFSSNLAFHNKTQFFH